MSEPVPLKGYALTELNSPRSETYAYAQKC